MKSRLDFAKVYEHGQVAVDATLVVNCLPNGRPYSRLGLSIPKKVGSAPRRNYWKRLIREAFRRQRWELPRGLDILVRPRKGAEPSDERIVRSLRRLTWRTQRKPGKGNTGHGRTSK